MRRRASKARPGPQSGERKGGRRELEPSRKCVRRLALWGGRGRARSSSEQKPYGADVRAVGARKAKGPLQMLCCLSRVVSDVRGWAGIISGLPSFRGMHGLEGARWIFGARRRTCGCSCFPRRRAVLVGAGLGVVVCVRHAQCRTERILAASGSRPFRLAARRSGPAPAARDADGQQAGMGI